MVSWPLARVGVMFLLLAAASSVAADNSAAQEARTTVSTLHRICDPYFAHPNEPDIGLPCLLYFEGITDGFLHAGYFGRSICMPQSARLPTIIRVIFDDFKADSPSDQGPAPTYVFRALMRSYPCEKSAK